METSTWTNRHMQYVQDSFDTGTVISAWLSHGTLTELDPMVQRLLAGQQLFVKQSDGSYRPKGWELGLPCGFRFSQLCDPALRPQRH
jgi:hypothetical protein